MTVHFNYGWKIKFLFSHTSDHIQNRPNYYVPIDMESIKPDPERPKIHFNANETYFYNTLPTRKATFVVNNNFISENLRIPKKNSYEEKIRILNSQGKPVRFRRDYAFVYWIMALVSWTRKNKNEMNLQFFEIILNSWILAHFRNSLFGKILPSYKQINCI